MTHPSHERFQDCTRVRLKVLSALFSYPDSEQFGGWLTDAKVAATELSDACLLESIQMLDELPREQLTRIYVDSFDMTEKNSLYLTAHELGESRERGAALVGLHMLLRTSGFEIPSNELPDYLPTLFELFAESEEEDTLRDLKCRVGVVCRAIEGRLAVSHPYRNLFTLANEVLPRKEDDHALTIGGHSEESDISPFTSYQGSAKGVNESESMPYPLVYD